MYVDCLDLSTVDFTGAGGPPPTHKFDVSAWTYDAVKPVVAADRVTDTKYGKLQGEEDYYMRAKQIIRDSLERLHSKLSSGGNSDVHEASVEKTVVASSTVPTSSDASGRPSPPVADVQATTTGIRTSRSDESVSARTAEILPTLLAMKDAAMSHATRSTSVEVDAPEINLSKEDSCSSDTDSNRVGGGTSLSTTEVAEATVHNDMPSTATPEEITPSLDEAYHRIEEAALQRRSSRGQGQSSSNVPAKTVSEDTIRSATPGSVRQHRVVHAPSADDYEPEVKAAKDQNQLYDIVKCFGNARSNSKHMKELKA
ncbi:hypothetical protein VPH35_092547 [Triticum aestivum]